MKKIITMLALLIIPFLASTQIQLDTIPVKRDTNYQEKVIVHYIETFEPVPNSWDVFHFDWKPKKLIVRIEKLKTWK